MPEQTVRDRTNAVNLSKLRQVMARWHTQAVELGFDGVSDLIAAQAESTAPAASEGQALGDEYEAALSELATQQDMTREQALRAAVWLYQAERNGQVEVIHKKQPPLMCDAAPAAQAEPEAIERLKDAIEGECGGLCIDDTQAAFILQYVRHGDDAVIPVPAAKRSDHA